MRPPAILFIFLTSSMRHLSTNWSEIKAVIQVISKPKLRRIWLGKVGTLSLPNFSLDNESWGLSHSFYSFNYCRKSIHKSICDFVDFSTTYLWLRGFFLSAWTPKWTYTHFNHRLKTISKNQLYHFPYVCHPE